MDLSSLLTEDQRLIADAARRFAEDHGGPARLRRVREAGEGYDAAALAAAAESGWTGLLVPERAGGAGLGPAALCLVMQELGRTLCVAPLGPLAAAAVALAESKQAGHAKALAAIL